MIQRVRTRAKEVTRHGTRRGPSQERVVRIHLGNGGRSYAYLCGGNPRLGSLVRANAPRSGTVERPVVGFGRGGWTGPLKRVTLVHR